jgi:hypothetical protein
VRASTSHVTLLLLYWFPRLSSANSSVRFRVQTDLGPEMRQDRRLALLLHNHNDLRALHPAAIIARGPGPEHMPSFLQ